MKFNVYISQWYYQMFLSGTMDERVNNHSEHQPCTQCVIVMIKGMQNFTAEHHQVTSRPVSISCNPSPWTCTDLIEIDKYRPLEFVGLRL